MVYNINRYYFILIDNEITYSFISFKNSIFYVFIFIFEKILKKKKKNPL